MELESDGILDSKKAKSLELVNNCRLNKSDSMPTMSDPFIIASNISMANELEEGEVCLMQKIKILEYPTGNHNEGGGGY